MSFWDASALVPLFLRQRASAAARTLYRKRPDVVVWWGTAVECESAIARLERAGELTPDETADARTRLSEAEAGWTEVEPSGAVRSTARHLLCVHDLRAGDALQLAAAVVFADGESRQVPVVCLDARLSAAARREGFTVVEP
jgi:predicted nucleic acid-binding protein